MNFFYFLLTIVAVSCAVGTKEGDKYYNENPIKKQLIFILII